MYFRSSLSPPSLLPLSFLSLLSLFSLSLSLPPSLSLLPLSLSTLANCLRRCMREPFPKGLVRLEWKARVGYSGDSAVTHRVWTGEREYDDNEMLMLIHLNPSQYGHSPNYRRLIFGERKGVFQRCPYSRGALRREVQQYIRVHLGRKSDLI